MCFGRTFFKTSRSSALYSSTCPIVLLGERIGGVTERIGGVTERAMLIRDELGTASSAFSFRVTEILGKLGKLGES